jgi:lipoyl-dependent peroxiredoxin
MIIHQKSNAVGGSTPEVMNVRYTAKTHTSGGRRGGVSRSDDGGLDVSSRLPESQELVPIRSSCLPPVGRPV